MRIHVPNEFAALALVRLRTFVAWLAHSFQSNINIIMNNTKGKRKKKKKHSDPSCCAL